MDIRNLQDLKLADVKALAKKIRTFLEPDGANTSTTLISEMEIRKYLVKECNVNITEL